MEVDLSIIIVNYKTPAYTDRAVASIVEQTKNTLYEIIIVDNNSEDESRHILTAKYPTVIWRQMQINVGFAGACNAGADIAKGKYILFLNSDTEILDGAIDKTLAYYKSHAQNKVGVVGCKLLNTDLSIQQSVYYFNADFKGMLIDNSFYCHFLIKLFPVKPRPIKVLKGAFLLMEKELFNKVGGFDPDFFMFYEECYMCRQIMKLNYSLEFFPEASIIHHGEKSFFSKSTLKQRNISSIILFYKVYGYFGILLYYLTYTLNFVSFLLFCLFYKPNIRKEELRNFKIFFQHTPVYLKKIKQCKR